MLIQTGLKQIKHNILFKLQATNTKGYLVYLPCCYSRVVNRRAASVALLLVVSPCTAIYCAATRCDMSCRPSQSPVTPSPSCCGLLYAAARHAVVITACRIAVVV